MRERLSGLLTSNTAFLSLAAILLTGLGASAPKLVAGEADCGDYICATPGEDNADCKKTAIAGCKVCKKDERCAIDTYDVD